MKSQLKIYNLVLLLSGGLDSALLLEMAKMCGWNPYCLLIDYGQKHVAELDFATQLCLKYEVAHSTVSIGGLDVASKLIDGDAKYAGVSEWHVPARNLIFIGIAVSFAESRGIPLIWYGANYEDREHLFPDCYQEWVYNVNKLLEMNGSMIVKVEAPLLGMQKETIKRLALRYDITNDKVFSGYGEQK